MIEHIKNKSLIATKAFINNEWINADSGKTFAVINPDNGQEIAQVSNVSVAETNRAIEAAQDAFPEWSSKSASERSSILRKWFNLIIENREDLAIILSTEQGKPLAESLGEINYGASFIEWFAEEAKRVYGDTIPGHQANKRIFVLKQPIGVVAAITPWNFPNAMITRKVAPALAVGCTVVIKPAGETPLSALALGVLALQAGFPKGVINILPTSNPVPIGEILCDSEIVRKISFTGSTAIGKWLMERSAKTLKKLSLELGGNAPFIVLDDADIDSAVEGAIASKYRNAGQTCVCANRIYVQKGIYDEFLTKFTKAVSAQKVGSAFEKDVMIGPLINTKALLKVESLISDSIKKGAKIEMGGKRHSKGENYFQPTVISGATAEMDFAKDEIFGPVAPIFKFETDQDVIFAANNTRAGLAAYFYGKDYKRVWNIAEALEYGIVGINTGLISTTVAPFGGVKESGFGREGSKYGIEDYLVLKYICMEI